MLTRIMKHLVDARSRAYDAYFARYGEYHPSDPRASQIIVGAVAVDGDDAIAAILRAANECHHDDVTVRPFDPSGPYA
jgi:hypothetical protein